MADGSPLLPLVAGEWVGFGGSRRVVSWGEGGINLRGAHAAKPQYQHASKSHSNKAAEDKSSHTATAQPKHWKTLRTASDSKEDAAAPLQVVCQLVGFSHLSAVCVHSPTRVRVVKADLISRAVSRGGGAATIF